MIGNAYNPDGGLLTRLSFLPTIPIAQHHVRSADAHRHRDTDQRASASSTTQSCMRRLFWGNPFAMLNALAAFETVHGYYLTPNGNGPNDPIAYGYEPDELADQLN